MSGGGFSLVCPLFKHEGTTPTVKAIKINEINTYFIVIML